MCSFPLLCSPANYLYGRYHADGVSQPGQPVGIVDTKEREQLLRQQLKAMRRGSSRS